MFIHIGERQIVSEKDCIGIFNYETLKKSDTNNWIIQEQNETVKTIVITNSSVMHSKVSPHTIIKRISKENDCYWRRQE